MTYAGNSVEAVGMVSTGKLLKMTWRSPNAALCLWWCRNHSKSNNSDVDTPKPH